MMDEVQKRQRIAELVRRVAVKNGLAARTKDPIRAARLKIEVARLEVDIARLEKKKLV